MDIFFLGQQNAILVEKRRRKSEIGKIKSVSSLRVDDFRHGTHENLHLSKIEIVRLLQVYEIRPDFH